MDTITGILLGGILSIVASIVPQVIQLVRVRSDRAYEMTRDSEQHVHELRRDYAVRAFEYQKTRFERARDACKQLISTIYEIQTLWVTSVTLRKELVEGQEETESLTTQMTQLKSAINEAFEALSAGKTLSAGDVARIEAFGAKNEELVARADEGLKTVEAQEKTNTEVMERIDALSRSAQDLIATLVLDLRAEDVSEKFSTFLRTEDKAPASEEARRAAWSCTMAIAAHLKAEEKSLVHAPE